MANILVADDDASIRKFLLGFFEENNHQVALAESGEKAIKLIQENIYDIAVLDVKMGNIGGLDVLESLKDISPDTEAIVITGKGTIPIAVQAMRSGAYDFITKPLNPNELKLVIDRSLERREIAIGMKVFQDQEREKEKFSNIIGSTPAISKVFDLIEKVCKFSTSVLITGESGTGKELVARTIHANSPRKNFPFMPVNCAAIPESLQETEFFGHAKGAFTDAVDQKRGFFEDADKGTIFLDEIADSSPSMQLKLLRFLEDGEIRRVGENTSIHVDVRLITATNKNILKAIEERNFREDLYYRIRVVEIRLPSLRERKDDIPLLADYFLKLYSKRSDKKIGKISPQTLKILMQYDWPGNVRELQSAIQYSVAFSNKDTISPEFLPSHIKTENGKRIPNIKNDRMTLREIEAVYINHILDSFPKNLTKASEILGVSRTTLYRKMKEYGKPR
ncbi:MAG: sigma-54 dependent transcriptional regulator [Candidatus Poribacteria bacterium]